MADIRNIALKNNTKLTINSKNYYPKYQKCQDGIIELSGSATNTGVIILPDNALEGIHPYKNVLADRKSTRLNSSHPLSSRMPSSA